jgi:hypothetical protein
MTTKRVPISRKSKTQITAKAIAAFCEMQRLESICSCEEVAWPKARDLCVACTAWWAHHSILVDELGLRPWQWPAVENPDAPDPYPAGSLAAQQWQPDHEARYRALERAAL